MYFECNVKLDGIFSHIISTYFLHFKQYIEIYSFIYLVIINILNEYFKVLSLFSKKSTISYGKIFVETAFIKNLFKLSTQCRYNLLAYNIFLIERMEMCLELYKNKFE